MSSPTPARADAPRRRASHELPAPSTVGCLGAAQQELTGNDHRLPDWARVALGLFTVAWGSNQSVPMLLVYERIQGISPVTVEGLFVVYAAALVIALFLSGAVGDRWGRAAFTRPAVALSAVASILFIVGHHSAGCLYGGRFLMGVANGVVLVAGTAWLKDLVARDPTSDTRAPARRTAAALSLGFGLGPLVAGAVAQWSPAPAQLPYLPHLVLCAVAIPAIWGAPETQRRAPGTTTGMVLRHHLRTRTASAHSRSPALSRRFLLGVAIAAPWVFVASAVAVALLPELVAGQVGHLAVVFSGIAAATSLVGGTGVQLIAGRLKIPAALELPCALLIIAVGLSLATATAAHPSPWLALVAALVLGLGYGLGLVVGLHHTQQIGSASHGASLTAVFYALTYIGFAVPLLLTSLRRVADYPVLLAVTSALACATLVTVAISSRTENARTS